MSDEKIRVGGGGIGLCGMTFIVFLVLKLAEIGVVAKWSWWAVTAPLWIPFLGVVAILGIVLLIAVIAALCDR